MNRIEYSKGKNLKYYISEEKRTVVCVMVDAEKELPNIIEKIILRNVKNDKYTHTYQALATSIFNVACAKYDLKNKKFTGRAVCHIDDEFDIEKGKEIARNKMLSKYFECIGKLFSDISYTLYDVYREVDKYACEFNKNSVMRYCDIIKESLVMQK